MAGTKDKLTLLVAKREKVFSRLQTLFDLSKTLHKQNFATFKARYDKIEDHYLAFDQIQDEIDLLSSKVDPSEAVDTKQSTASFEEMYYAVKAAGGQYIKVESEKPVSQSSHVKLPDISIPLFDGDIKNWSNFHGLFTSLIHNNVSLPNVEKLQFLRTYVKGSALSLIEHLPLTNENYPIAYNTLVERYQNKRVLASFYFGQITKFKALTSDSLAGLNSFVDVFKTNVAALNALSLDDIGDFILLYIALQALDPQTRKSFEAKYTSSAIPTYGNLMDFVQDQCKILELTQPHNLKSTHKVSYHSLRPPKPPYTAKNVLVSSTTEPLEGSTSAPPQSCPVCSESHKIQHCPSFTSKTPSERHTLIISLKRCFNCLGNHMITSCTSNSHCKTCKGTSHHSLLHFPSNRTSSKLNTSSEGNKLRSPPPNANTLASKSLSCNKVASTKQGQTVLLGTAQALIKDTLGAFHQIRLVVDPGSQVSCITSSCAQQLGLPRSKTNVQLTGLGNINVPPSKGTVKCTLVSNINNNHKISSEAIVLTHISSKLPSVPISKSVQERFDNLKLADPAFSSPSKIDFLLGADLYPQILTRETSVIQGNPCAISTLFGWIIMGNAPTELHNPQYTSLFVSSPCLDSLVSKFWELEEFPKSTPQSPEDIFCESHFQETFYRDSSGRYVVSYPFKETPPVLGTSRQSALSRFHKLEFRLENKPALREQYHNFISDYESLNHMSKAQAGSSYVIPHHCVTNSNSLSTKLRVVFDGSAKGSSGVSLNDTLLKGPKLQKDISDIILNFRLKPVALCADLKMMYRQILVSKDQRKYQHIFWRYNLSEPVQEYEMNTVTYGLSSSPFLAQRVLKQLAIDEGSKFPVASEVILNDTYIDDVVTSVDDELSALDLHSQLVNLLQAGGFSLHKWASNSSRVLQNMPFEHLEHPLLLDSDTNHVTKVLGLQWDSQSDTFQYQVSSPTSKYTKRSVLSHLARIFDPVGWLSPTIFLAKHLLQLIWQGQVGWDDELPSSLHSMWHDFTTELPQLKNIRIPRFVFRPNPSSTILVGFCDASEKGYGAVTYLVHSPTHTQPDVMLLRAKSKVAPLKTLSIPRLELCAAVLLARLVGSLENFIAKTQISSVYLFTDSTIVLAWLKTPPHLLKIFVANRVVETLDHTDISFWRHISSHNNPADMVSRGVYPTTLVNASLWWTGPDFLQLPVEKWPTCNQPSLLQEDDLPDLKTTTIVHLAATSENPLLTDIERYSSLFRLQRVFAYVLRFIKNTTPNSSKTIGPLTPHELQESLKVCVRLTQETAYVSELEALTNGKGTLTTQLQKLSPFLDEEGLLRVGGRLKYSPLPHISKHPLLLPKKSHLSSLICDFYHVTSLHSGPRTTQALIQKRFWITSLRSLLRQRIHQCLKCHKFNASPPQPIMAPLPSSRFTHARAFLNVGLDMAGPFNLKESTRRNAKISKSYLCLFVCMSTKALHLELTSDLSTPAFLCALDRFIGRRGLPANIYSDCGSNFIGAANYLQEVYQFLLQENENIFNHLAQREIQWHFNPPSAPNFGGLWEAGVKSVKHHMKRCIGDKALTFEEMSSVLVRIEAVLNSRPLCPVSNDPHDDNDYLTPGHFLIGSSFLTPVEYDVTQIPENRLNRWQLQRQMIQSFWKLWSTEYLSTLIPRQKWTKTVNPLSLGDLVYIQGQKTTPLNWPLAKIEALYPGKDGVVRVAKVRTKSGELLRPVNKLIPLPVS